MQEDRRAGAFTVVLEFLAAQLDEVAQWPPRSTPRIMAWHKANPVSRRLVTIPASASLIATAIAATVPDRDAFRGGREFMGLLASCRGKDPPAASRGWAGSAGSASTSGSC